MFIFLPTHPLRGATGQRGEPEQHHDQISTHAPLAGCDGRGCRAGGNRFYFYPRTPCGVRHSPPALGVYTCLFLPTHPLRGATDRRLPRVVSREFLPTHPLRGATGRFHTQLVAGMDFYPRTPCGVRPLQHHGAHDPVDISTHAPLAGCDSRRGRCPSTATPFLPTHPLRGATGTRVLPLTGQEFLPTHPLRGATW